MKENPTWQVHMGQKSCKNAIVLGGEDGRDRLSRMIGRDGGGARVGALAALAVGVVVVLFEHLVQVLVASHVLAEQIVVVRLKRL